jgi:uncharacterized Zn-finger protein
MKKEREPTDFVGVWCPYCGAAITEHRTKKRIESGTPTECPYCNRICIPK